MMNQQVSCGSTEGRTSVTLPAEREHVELTRSGECRQTGSGRGFDYRPSEYQASPAGKISEATSHLRVALLQAHPDDDQIILEHVREALKLLEEK